VVTTCDYVICTLSLHDALPICYINRGFSVSSLLRLITKRRRTASTARPAEGINLEGRNIFSQKLCFSSNLSELILLIRSASKFEGTFTCGRLLRVLITSLYLKSFSLSSITYSL